MSFFELVPVQDIRFCGADFEVRHDKATEDRSSIPGNHATQRNQLINIHTNPAWVPMFHRDGDVRNPSAAILVESGRDVRHRLEHAVNVTPIVVTRNAVTHDLERIERQRVIRVHGIKSGRCLISVLTVLAGVNACADHPINRSITVIACREESICPNKPVRLCGEFCEKSITIRFVGT